MANPAFVYRPPTTPYLELLYQDDDLVVTNKPSGLLSVPGKAPEHRDSLISRVQSVFPTATVVHRLDMATSGVMVMAMNKASHRHLSRQFETRQTQKRYFARVYGQLGNLEGEVDLPLICDWPNRPKQKVDFEHGKPALTRYQAVSTSAAETLVALYPVTGRSHQLRVHMLALGHPILGDRLYAHEQALAAAQRLQLHAESLVIRHPVSNRWCRFVAPIPFASYSPEPMLVPQD
ncbi:bifunctional tRNA pseudouridine(32) synthase/23S rRNA pseudouridine(746) synthase RluA [Alteromonas aestuariivivens]|uniref:Dual-specificity RNA pseudouridine synthase RluA n=1 Tax=Alteromonas aestuariivivens TaxID=1938339 RepID=A0A3D8MC43_9ALTE|nr:bifunctional tRNA pseudouridine(32) synthase/23S rRNA pseudouridine(746) synthase RluA [Alteromonas aestuariivivens]RDV27961.1 bifunctional tRNA pseudouridine(32) synthase/23S rRNA pseudouridine(746) synthase RluA [Alteromonas aestuariivivens]